MLLHEGTTIISHSTQVPKENMLTFTLTPPHIYHQCSAGYLKTNTCKDKIIHFDTCLSKADTSF